MSDDAFPAPRRSNETTPEGSHPTGVPYTGVYASPAPEPDPTPAESSTPQPNPDPTPKPNPAPSGSSTLDTDPRPSLPAADPTPEPDPSLVGSSTPDPTPATPTPVEPPATAAPVESPDTDTGSAGSAAGLPDTEIVTGPGLRAALEAILLVIDEPVPEITLAQVLERPTHEVVAALHELAAEYTEQGRGFDLREVAGGWRYYTRADCAQLVERFIRDGQQTRLTQAALETLAVVAYRQPVSRARVAAVRGVNSDGVMRTLVARGLVEEAGTDPESQAVLYRTSSYFLERLGLKSVDELPELAPFLPDDVENLEEISQ